MIFQLEWVTHDCHSAWHFEAPEGATLADFQALCNRLGCQAAEDAVEGKMKSPLHQNTCDTWFGYNHMCEEIAARLAEHGYKRVELPTVYFYNGMIIRRPEEDEMRVFPPEVLEKVITHNKKIETSLSRWREEIRVQRLKEEGV